MAAATLTKESMPLGLAFRSRRLVHCHHERKHGGMLADTVLEKALRVLHLDLQTAGRESEPLGLA